MTILSETKLMFLIKLHPRYLAYYAPGKPGCWGTVPLTRNLLDNTARVRCLLEDLKEELFRQPGAVTAVYYESPHVVLDRENRMQVILDIVHIQRLMGVVEYLINELYHIRPCKAVQKQPKPAKDAIIKRAHTELSPILGNLEALCLGDLLLLYDHVTNK